MDRVIFHCDLNCFYASVELLSHPELREVPVAVAGDPRLPPWDHFSEKRARQAVRSQNRRNHLAGQKEMP